MRNGILLAAAAALTFTATPAMAQDSPADQIGRILGALFGERTPTGTVESQWDAGQMPLTNQRGAFEQRVDADVRSGALTSATAARLKYDYYQLTQLESRYGADRRYTAQERQELAYGYNKLTQVLADGSYADGATDTFVSGGTSTGGEIAQGRGEFEQRVDAAVNARRIRRTTGTRLKAEYTALIDIESAYLRDGVLSSSERADLERRLDDLDARVGDTGYASGSMTSRQRLEAIAGQIPRIGVSSATQAQLRVQVEDLARLERAYERITTSADERDYLERRLTELETQVGLRR